MKKEADEASPFRGPPVGVDSRQSERGQLSQHFIQTCGCSIARIKFVTNSGKNHIDTPGVPWQPTFLPLLESKEATRVLKYWIVVERAEMTKQSLTRTRLDAEIEELSRMQDAAIQDATFLDRLTPVQDAEYQERRRRLQSLRSRRSELDVETEDS